MLVKLFNKYICVVSVIFFWKNYAFDSDLGICDYYVELKTIWLFTLWKWPSLFFVTHDLPQVYIETISNRYENSPVFIFWTLFFFSLPQFLHGHCRGCRPIWRCRADDFVLFFVKVVLNLSCVYFSSPLSEINDAGWWKWTS